MLLLGAVVSQAFAQTQISLGPSAGSKDDVLQVPILLGTNAQLAGIQIELSFDPALASIGDPEVASTATRFRTIGSGVGVGEYRLLVLGEQGDVLPSGRIVNLPITLKQNVAAGQSAVTMTEVMIADEYGLERSYAMAPYLEVLPPNNGEAVEPLAPVSLSTVADFGGGDITDVEIYANGRLIGSFGSGETPPDWTPEEPGTTRIKAVGVRSDGSSVESAAVEVPVNGPLLEDYDTWKAYYFSVADAADAQVSGPTQDPDSDNRNNLREYAEGSNPTVSDDPPVSPSPFFVQNSGKSYFAVRMRRRIQVSDVAVSAVVSSDLANPTESAVTNLEEAGNFEVVTFHSLSSLEEQGKGFLQIVVSQPEAP